MAQGQARFTRRYTNTQKEALLRAVCVEGMTIPAAVEKAAAGELGVPAFKPHRTYAYQIIKDEREAFEAANPDAMRNGIDLAINRLAAKTLRLARELERKQDPNPDEIKRTVQALKAAQHALAKPAPRQPTNPNTDPSEPKSADVLGALLGNVTNGRAEPVRSAAR